MREILNGIRPDGDGFPALIGDHDGLVRRRPNAKRPLQVLPIATGRIGPIVDQDRRELAEARLSRRAGVVDGLDFRRRQSAGIKRNVVNQTVERLDNRSVLVPDADSCVPARLVPTDWLNRGVRLNGKRSVEVKLHSFCRGVESRGEVIPLIVLNRRFNCDKVVQHIVHLEDKVSVA